MTSQGFPTSTVLKRQSSGAVRRLIAVLERVLGRRDYRNALTKDGVKEPAYARNHDDHEIPKQMGRIRMATRNPQSWFSHGAPPTDEWKLAGWRSVQSINRSVSCVVLCHGSHRKEVGSSTQATGKATCRELVVNKLLRVRVKS